MSRPQSDAALSSLCWIARHHGLPADRHIVAHSLGLSGRRLASNELVRAAQLLGMKAGVYRNRSLAFLARAPTPVLLRLNDQSWRILQRVGSRFHLLDANTETTTALTGEDLDAQWSGHVVLLAAPGFQPEQQTFGIGWFARTIGQYKTTLLHIVIASFFIQLLAIATPLLFQVIIDKALVHRSVSTLIVIGAAMVLSSVASVVLTYLRTYALSHTSNKVDVELGSRLFSRLLRLPISYFEQRPTGQTVARLRQIENVRNFLTGQALGSVLDLVFSSLLIIVLFIYSGVLTLIVLASVACYLLVVTSVRPVLRARIKERFARNALSSQYVVEAIVGVQTIKAAAVEPLVLRQWENRLAAYVHAAFRATMLASLGQNLMQLISRLTTAAILLVGAGIVMAGKLTVGELVAFNMVAGQLASPILRLSNLWQDFQQVQVSIERIGDIYNAEPEHEPSTSTRLPVMQGRIELKEVSFRYSESGPLALNNLSLCIPAGQVVGIVGHSGSGKSTLAKIIQRFYEPTSGIVLIDGRDIAQTPTAWVRGQTGVVLQENLLFNRTIHENIAFTRPTMSRESVEHVAHLAGADEFIRELKDGYDTMVVERGSNMSGGQRQRIAIARALARNPQVLIFDEATSALDYESELMIRKNMKKIVAGRTVVVIAHRLAAVRDCDRIIGLSRGAIVEDGTHDELMRIPCGLYSGLWAIQNEN